MQEMIFGLLLVGLDLVLVQAISLVQVSPLFLPYPVVTVWGACLARACLLSLACTAPACPQWVRSSEGLQRICVLCFLYPVYVCLLCVRGQSAPEELWAWSSWTRVLQSYVLTMVSWLYWSKYVSSFLLSCWTCVCSFGKPSERRKAGSTSSLRRMLGYMAPYTGRFVLVFALVNLSSFGETAIPKYTGHVADWIANEDSSDLFSQTIKMMTVMTVASVLCEFICDMIYNVTMSRVHTSVQGIVFQAVMQQEMAFFDVTPTGELVSRITTDTNDLSEALSEKLSLAMWYTSRFGFLMFFMFSLSWKMSLLTLMGLPIVWFIPEITGHFHQTISAKVQESLAKANQVATETFTHIKTVRSFANEDGETERYRQRMEDTYALNKQEALAYAASTWTNSMTTLALKVGILYYGGRLVTRGMVSSGDLVSFILYELQLASTVEAFMHSYPEVRKAIGASEKIFEYLNRTPKIPPEGDLAPDSFQGHIEFKNVKFSYSGSTEDSSLVLKDVSMEIRPGQITALVGLNRCGKTTCVKLLERFYQPLAGEILLDGQPLQRYKNLYLHQKMAVVSQDCILFNRSVRENIKYGCEDASDEEMERAARLASAHHFIQELPNGYDTAAGERGGQVAGGQKQRITIARALIRRPKILILDNATSDLDTENEHQINQALQELARDCTVLLISTKMSAVENASRIIVLNNGVVEDVGTHGELLEKGGLYAEMVAKQNMGFHRQAE
ncbi:antigen peptide transporter 1 isoform X1 [Synchiropus splendidus]|uniref:antigen peptide transporter 1 isoform X1 n=1 Tax=Synchiropus splendidus TaxID=270530 RepID=UPI00237D4E8C|nr:antigen peptide transporter 1 isoform X1 [Synchiropus splendidus]